MTFLSYNHKYDLIIFNSFTVYDCLNYTETRWVIIRLRPFTSVIQWLVLVCWFASLQVMVVIKYIFQFGFFPWNSVNKITLNKDKPFFPPRIFGLEKTDNYIRFDLLQLLALFFHRSLLMVSSKPTFQWFLLSFIHKLTKIFFIKSKWNFCATLPLSSSESVSFQFNSVNLYSAKSQQMSSQFVGHPNNKELQ